MTSPNKLVRGVAAGVSLLYALALYLSGVNSTAW